MARFFRPIALATAVASLAGFGLVPAARMLMSAVNARPF